jgi:hypothetical protein
MEALKEMELVAGKLVRSAFCGTDLVSAKSGAASKLWKKPNGVENEQETRP